MTLDGTSILASNTNSAQSFSVTNTPSVEAIAEFAVESSGFKAESGHASGGSVTFVSKSGTNQFHGSAYEFLRNQKMDARGFLRHHQVDSQAEQLRRHDRRPGAHSQDLRRPQ